MTQSSGLKKVFWCAPCKYEFETKGLWDKFGGWGDVRALGVLALGGNTGSKEDQGGEGGEGEGRVMIVGSSWGVFYAGPYPGGKDLVEMRMFTGDLNVLAVGGRKFVAESGGIKVLGKIKIKG